jgi:hypothetical protein
MLRQQLLFQQPQILTLSQIQANTKNLLSLFLNRIRYTTVFTFGVYYLLNYTRI